MRGGNPGPTSARFSKARSPQTCRSCSRRSSSWSLTSRPPGCLASPCHRHCWSLPTRLSNDREDEAARVHHAARRRGSGVAAGGTRAAAGGAGGRGPQQPVGIGNRKAGRFVRSGIDRDGLCRWSGRNGRAALGGWSIRSTARTCGRTVNRRVNLIAALAPPATFAAKAATTAIPIVFLAALDRVRAGLVASLNRPGGNITGITFIGASLGGKRLELARELVPNVGVIGLLTHPRSPDALQELRELQSDAKAIGQQLLVLSATSEDDLESAFASMAQHGVRVLLIGQRSACELRPVAILTKLEEWRALVGDLAAARC